MDYKRKATEAMGIGEHTSFHSSDTYWNPEALLKIADVLATLALAQAVERAADTLAASLDRLNQTLGSDLGQCARDGRLRLDVTVENIS